MNNFTLTHLSDRALLVDLNVLVAQDRANTAALLAHIAEVDARKLYLPAACPSMYVYCVEELHLSEDEAFARIRAARTARQYPVVFTHLAEGRLSLSAVLLLRPHLTADNAGELLAAAVHKTRSEVQQLLADKFPRLPVPDSLESVVSALPVVPAPAPALSAPSQLEEVPSPEPELSHQLVSKRVDVTTSVSRVQRLSSESSALQCTITRATHEKLLYAQALLRHKIPSGDLSEVLDEALNALIVILEKSKFAATARPRPVRSCPEPGDGQEQGGRREPGRRHVPSAVKRAVWLRDGGQCTFVGPHGRRCTARAPLEFDHVEPFSRGGEATVDGIRLLCRAHNQFAAECTFGVGFMDAKRERARREVAERRAGNKWLAASEHRTRAAAGRTKDLDVIPWLRKLGFRADEARRAAELSQARPEASLEERVRLALSCADFGRHSSSGFTEQPACPWPVQNGP